MSSDRDDPRRRRRAQKRGSAKGSPPHDGPGLLRRAAKIGTRLAITGTVAWALLVGVREGYDYATTSPRFEVRALTFESTPHVDDETLRSLMALTPGTNILSLDLEALAARIAAHPWVAEASVVRVLPDSLNIAVTEYEASAVLMASVPMLMNKAGRPFKRLQPGERGQLPLVTGVDEMSLVAGTAAGTLAITRVTEALEAWRGKRRPRLGEVHVGDAGEVTLYTAERGTQLTLGRGALAPALARYDALRAALGEDSESLAVVHLDHTRGPDRPDRIIATFLPTESPEVLQQVQAEAEARDQAAVAERNETNPDPKRRGQRRNKARSRLPSYN